MYVHEVSAERVRHHPRRRRPSTHVPRVAIFSLAVMSSLGLAALFLAISAQGTQTTLPLLKHATSHSIEEGVVTVTGSNFTAGGDVLIAIQDMWGVTTFEQRWTTASEHTLATNGSHDPGLGFHPGGAVHETFGGLCGQTVTVRALDAYTGTLSTALDLDVDCDA